MPIGANILAHIGIAQSSRSALGGGKGDAKSRLQYLLELESKGNTDACLFNAIGECYFEGRGCKTNIFEAFDYYLRAANLGYGPAYVSLHRLWAQGQESIDIRRYFSQHYLFNKLLKAEEKGVKDDRILDIVVSFLVSKSPDFIPSEKALGDFKNKTEMALHYCDVLIKRHSPRGYYWKGMIYAYGMKDVPIDEEKALQLWDEAGVVGMARHKDILEHAVRMRLTKREYVF